MLVSFLLSVIWFKDYHLEASPDAGSDGIHGSPQSFLLQMLRKNLGIGWYDFVK
jgi:hypothetical protein